MTDRSRTLNKLLESELIAYMTIGDRRKIDLAELLSRSSAGSASDGRASSFT